MKNTPRAKITIISPVSFSYWVLHHQNLHFFHHLSLFSIFSPVLSISIILCTLFIFSLLLTSSVSSSCWTLAFCRVAFCSAPRFYCAFMDLQVSSTTLRQEVEMSLEIFCMWFLSEEISIFSSSLAWRRIFCIRCESSIMMKIFSQRNRSPLSQGHGDVPAEKHAKNMLVILRIIIHTCCPTRCISD